MIPGFEGAIVARAMGALVTSTFWRGLVVAIGLGVIFALMTIYAPDAMAIGDDIADEIIFYSENGQAKFYEMHTTGALGEQILSTSGYTTGWTSIVAVELDGGGQDELFFYRSDGEFRFYDVGPDGSLGAPLIGGSGYSAGWTTITAIDLDGDGSDEMFFYRSTDGVYKYYDMHTNGALGELIRGGSGYTTGWSSISAVDLDNDGQDEIFFYRPDGNYRYYDIQPNGSLGPIIRSGNDYTTGWDIITSINLDEDLQDEMLFYRNDGAYRYYDISSNASLGAPIQAGSGYSTDWSIIAPVNLQGDFQAERVARFTTYYDCCQNRVTNIRLIAAETDEVVVLPGETFSLDALTGPRTSAEGYLPAPYLQNGQGKCCAVGGGISQFGTTIFNAVFWGGYDVVTFRPHSGWISRYPLGIEATLVYSSIDYKFKNDTVTPVTIRTSSTSTSVTVEIWGHQGGWQMTGHHPRGRRSSSITVLDQGDETAKRVSARVTGNAPGLIRVDRTLTQNGSSSTESWWWNYVT